jgi:hypothetical protein
MEPSEVASTVHIDAGYCAWIQRRCLSSYEKALTKWPKAIGTSRSLHCLYAP